MAQKKILIVEPDWDIRGIMVRFLGETYEVQAGPGGGSDVLAFLIRVRASWRPDLIVVDRAVWVTGVSAFLDELKKEMLVSPDVKVILTSTGDVEDLVHEAEAIGAIPVPKPLNPPTVFIESVRQALGE